MTFLVFLAAVGVLTRMSNFSNLQSAAGIFSFVGNVLSAVCVFEPCSIDNTVRRAVALHEIVDRMIQSIDRIADGSSNTLLCRLLLVIRCEIPRQR